MNIDRPCVRQIIFALVAWYFVLNLPILRSLAHISSHFPEREKATLCCMKMRRNFFFRNFDLLADIHRNEKRARSKWVELKRIAKLDLMVDVFLIAHAT